jgi:lipopolysaccharide transport system ATP-binding protein
MSDVAIEVDRVWKRFRRGEMYDSLRDLLPALAARALGRHGGAATGAERDFWALEDVSFQLQRGQALGIIGPNGAGKSTLLKILSRILKPNRGRCRVNGRLRALIEVTAGFHPDLTGRENIYLNGSILGMPRREIARKLDQIIAFSGIEAFIDTPVKRYSSGMQARLGFSVAAHLDPDVLLVDEVLSVGDMSFQQRCLERMRETLTSGASVVIVSHNLQTVATLCRRCLVLSAGKLLLDGPTGEALDAYMSAGQTSGEAGERDQPRAVLRRAALRRADGGPAHLLAPHTACALEVALECQRPINPFNVGFIIRRTRDLLYCYGATTEELGIELIKCRQGDEVRVTFHFVPHLTRGHYRIDLNLRDPKSANHLAHFENVANFVIDENVSYDGVADVELTCTAEPRPSLRHREACRA